MTETVQETKERVLTPDIKAECHKLGEELEVRITLPILDWLRVFHQNDSIRDLLTGNLSVDESI